MFLNFPFWLGSTYSTAASGNLIVNADQYVYKIPYRENYGKYSVNQTEFIVINKCQVCCHSHYVTIWNVITCYNFQNFEHIYSHWKISLHLATLFLPIFRSMNFALSAFWRAIFSNAIWEMPCILSSLIKFDIPKVPYLKRMVAHLWILPLRLLFVIISMKMTSIGSWQFWKGTLGFYIIKQDTLVKIKLPTKI